jgi:hypothetical protein
MKQGRDHAGAHMTTVEVQDKPVVPRRAGEPGRVGRPTKLTPEIALDVAARVARGESQASAAKANGIDPCTVKRWCRVGRADAAAGRRTDHAALAELVRDAARQWLRTFWGPAVSHPR